jgi:DNA primase
MPTFDTGLISRIQQANDIVDVIGEHLALKRKGREMLGLCPFHEDHRPSFNVNPTKQIFKCFACGAGGDVIKFIQMRENLTFPQALQRLADRAGIKVEPLRPRSTNNEQRTMNEQADPNDIARANAWAAKYFAANLAHPEKGKDTRKYVTERQLSEDSVKNWQIGLALGADNDLLTAARQKKIPDKLLLAAGLVVGAGSSLSDKFVNRLIFTIADVTGRIIGFGGRTLSGEGAKYINSPTTALFDKSNSLFGLDHARHQMVSSDTVVVVEGYTDGIMAHQFGVSNVVATLGTSFTAGHARILRRYAKKVVLLFDSDTAGLEAANRALGVALGSHIDIAIASVPQGKDPCDFLLAQGKDPFEKLIENATDVFTFKWARLNANLGSQPTLAGKKQAVDEYLDAIATAITAGNLSAIERGLIINNLARVMSLDAKEIHNELTRRSNRARTASAYSGAADDSHTPLDLGEGLSANAQREILEVLLAHPSLFDDIKDKISPQNFDVPALERVAQAVFQTLSKKTRASIQTICSAVEDPQLAGLMTTLEHEGAEKDNFTKRLADALTAMEHVKQQENKITGDQQDLTRCVAKQNPRNMGMV